MLSGLLLSAFLLLCFTPMFMRHSRRRAKLRALHLDDAEPGELEAFTTWKKEIKANAGYADAAAICFSAAWFTAPAIPVIGILPMFAALVLPFMANRARRRATEAKQALPMLPQGHKWLDARRGPSVGG